MYTNRIYKNKQMIDMPRMTEFEEEYYKSQGLWYMDPDKFYADIPDNPIEENVQKPS